MAYSRFPEFVFRLWIIIIISLVCLPTSYNFFAKELNQNNSSKKIKIHYNDNLLTIQADKVPLEIFLKTVSEKTGIIFSFKNHALKKDLVTIHFKNIPLSRAIKRILGNYSFSEIQTKDQRCLVTILDAKGKKHESTSIKPSKAITRLLSGVVQNNDQNKHLQSIITDKPRELSEVDDIEPWQFLVPEEIPCESNEEQDCSKPRIQYVVDKEAYENARIRRAKTILNKGQTYIYPYIVQDLSEMKDNPEAKNMLLQLATTRSNAVTKDIRLQAVQVLWGLTGDKEFQDDSINNTLQKLAKDKDPQISSLAQKALRDMEKFNTRKEYMAFMND